MMVYYPDGKVHGAKMGPIWVLSAPDGPHVGPMNLAIRVVKENAICNMAVILFKSNELTDWSDICEYISM